MLIKITLDNKAINFIIQRFKSFSVIGHNLMSKMINKIYTSKYTVWGYFPKGILENELKEFEYGGKFPDSPLNEVVELVKNIMNKGNSWLLIDNNGNVKYSANQNSIENITVAFFWDNIVLHFYNNKEVISENIKETFRATGAYPFIGFSTSIKEDIEKRILANNINEYDIDYLIQNITYLFIGAYDEEGYLIVEFE